MNELNGQKLLLYNCTTLSSKSILRGVVHVVGTRSQYYANDDDDHAETTSDCLTSLRSDIQHVHRIVFKGIKFEIQANVGMILKDLQSSKISKLAYEISVK